MDQLIMSVPADFSWASLNTMGKTTEAELNNLLGLRGWPVGGTRSVGAPGMSQVPIQAPQPRHPPPLATASYPTTSSAGTDWSSQLPTSTIPNPAWSTIYDAPPPPSSFPSVPFPESPYPPGTYTPFSTPLYAPTPAFYSSYGIYQPIQGPYSRFLTPSPEPDVLDTLGLQEMFSSFRSTTEDQRGAGSSKSGGGEMTFESMWRDFDERAERERVNRETGTVASMDPFAGMDIEEEGRSGGATPIPTMVMPPPQDIALEGIKTGRSHSFGGMKRARSHDELAGRDRRTSADQYGTSTASSFPPSIQHQQQQRHAFPQDPFLNLINPTPQPHLHYSYPLSQPQAQHLPSTPSALVYTPTLYPPPSANPSPASASTARSKRTSSSALPKASKSKKSRNPPSTQVPGGPRKVIKAEAGVGHEGPSCSHCRCVVTPLWRRGPSEELLCNACGLYLKQHGTERPLNFTKHPIGLRGRTSTGAAAQAAASLVPPSCHNCEATSTPMWRKDAEGNLCCNACCLYFKLHNKPRPLSLSKRNAPVKAVVPIVPIAPVAPIVSVSSPPIPPSITLVALVPSPPQAPLPTPLPSAPPLNLSIPPQQPAPLPSQVIKTFIPPRRALWTSLQSPTTATEEEGGSPFAVRVSNDRGA